MWKPLKLWWRYKLLGGRLASLAQDRSSLLQLKEVYGEERSARPLTIPLMLGC